MNALGLVSGSEYVTTKPAPPRTTSFDHGFHQKFHRGVADPKSLPLSSEPVAMRNVTSNDCVKFLLSEMRTRGVIWRSPKLLW